MSAPGYFEIQSSDPKRDVAFYEALFGWKFTLQSSQPIVYYRIETNGINGGLLTRPAAAPMPGSGTNAFVCSMQVDSFDAVSKKIV